MEMPAMDEYLGVVRRHKAQAGRAGQGGQRAGPTVVQSDKLDLEPFRSERQPVYTADRHYRVSHTLGLLLMRFRNRFDPMRPFGGTRLEPVCDPSRPQI